MKILSTTVRPRLKITPNKRNDILNYGEDNAYPQMIEKLIKASPTAKKCSIMLAKFIRGGGFENENLNTLIVDRKGTTLAKLLRGVSIDLSRHKGFALHFNYNLEGKITSVSRIPFKHVRRGTPDDENYSGKYLVSANWDRSLSPNILKKKIKTYHAYNPIQNVIHSQVEASGGIQKYNGQLMYVTMDDDSGYPESVSDVVIKDMDTEALISEFKHNTLNRGFMADYFLLTSEDFDEDTNEEEEFKKEIESFQGAENKGSIMTINLPDVEDLDKVFKLVKVEQTINDKIFVNWEKSIPNNIRGAFNNIPPVLVDTVESKLGHVSGQQIIEATNFYNGMTRDERELVEETFKMIFKNHSESKFNEEDCKIIPFQLIDSEVEQNEPKADPKEGSEDE